MFLRATHYVLEHRPISYRNFVRMFVCPSVTTAYNLNPGEKKTPGFYLKIAWCL